jgi:hypothetical protein|nr:MAG TPA: Protein of unknown function (DUF3626) [Caudoviricetes sp.]
MRRVALGLMALSMRLDAYAIHKGMTMDAAHPKDPDPKNWRTINGSKVHLTEGKIDGGAGGKFTGKEWTGKTKHEFTPKEKPKQEEAKTKAKKPAENPKSAPKLQAITKPQAKKVETGAFEQISSSKQKNNISFLATYGALGGDVSAVPEVKSIQKYYGLGNAEVAAIKNVYEELKNKKISKEAFKDTVASIIKYGAVGEIPQPKAKKLGARAEQTNTSEMDKSFNKYNATTGKEHERAVRKFVKEGIERATASEVQDFYRKNPPKTLDPKKHKKVMREYNDSMERHLKSVGVTEKEIEDFKQNIQRIVSNSDYCMQIDSEYLENCNEDWFKNLFETKTSNGLDDEGARRAASSNLFGCDTEKIKAFDMERYGFAGQREMGSQTMTESSYKIAGGALGYGDATVQFKKDRLKGRVTYTLGDSLGPASNDPPLRAALVGEKTLAGCPNVDAIFNPMDDTIKRIIKNMRKEKSYTLDMLTKDLDSYVELQYHGALTMADVEAITIDKGKLSTKVISKIRERGVKVYIRAIMGGKIHIEEYDAKKN